MDAQAVERYRVALPRRYWYVACRSSELRRRPIARSILGTPLVLFRGPAARPAALLDRCAHRNLPLSVGRVDGAEIECAYHGWRYDGSGACRHIPALVDESERRGRGVPSFAATEQQGYVWVYGEAGETPAGPPFAFPHLGEAGYASVRFAAEVDATLHATLENMLDVPHTAFLHRGLFRGGSRQAITAIARRFADRAEVEYLGERRPGGLVARLLAPQGGTVVHFDRFLLPSIAQVEYRLGASHLVVTNAATPVAEFRTRIVSMVSFHLPMPAWLVRAVLSPLVRRIFRQDAQILRLQTEAVRRFGGESYVSTEVDLIGPHVWHLLRRGERGERPADRATPEFEKRIELRV